MFSLASFPSLDLSSSSFFFFFFFFFFSFVVVVVVFFFLTTSPSPTPHLAPAETAEGKPEDSVKCLNGGTCRDRVGGFDCECAPGFMGPRCNSSGPCFNYCSGTASCVLLDPAATICDSIFCKCSCDVSEKPRMVRERKRERERAGSEYQKSVIDNG